MSLNFKVKASRQSDHLRTAAVGIRHLAEARIRRSVTKLPSRANPEERSLNSNPTTNGQLDDPSKRGPISGGNIMNVHGLVPKPRDPRAMLSAGLNLIGKPLSQ